MVSRRKVNRRWWRWCRYWQHYDRLGDEAMVITAGGIRAYEALARVNAIEPREGDAGAERGSGDLP